MKFKTSLSAVAVIIATSACADMNDSNNSNENNSNIVDIPSTHSYLAPTPVIDMKPRPDEAGFPDYAKYLVEVAFPRTEEEMALDEAVMARYKGAHVVDVNYIGAPGFPAGFSDQQFEEYADHMIENDFSAFSITMSNGSDGSVPEVFERFEYTNDYLTKVNGGDKYIQILQVSDFDRVLTEGKIGVFYNFQSMNAFGDDIKNIEKYYNLGLRRANFTYNKDNAFGGGSVSNEDGSNDGVTEYGYEVIREMNRIGMVVDCSHSSNQTCIDMATASSKPVIMSHSNVATIMPIGRNASDEAIKAVGATNGVVCVNFIGGFLNPQGDARPFAIAKHVQYIRNLIGVQATCQASDYVYNYYDTLLWILKNPDQFPPSMGYASPSHMGMPGEVWGVVAILEGTYGWTKEEIRGFLGENIIRVYKENWE